MFVKLRRNAMSRKLSLLFFGALLLVGTISGFGQSVLDYNVELAPALFGTTQTIYSAYVEDAISLSNKLNVSVGLRYDYDNLSKGGSTSGDYNNISPRLSANYKLTENSSIRGGFGIFYDKVLYTIYSDALQQNTTSSDYKKEIQDILCKKYGI